MYRQNQAYQSGAGPSIFRVSGRVISAYCRQMFVPTVLEWNAGLFTYVHVCWAESHSILITKSGVSESIQECGREIIK